MDRACSKLAKENYILKKAVLIMDSRLKENVFEQKKLKTEIQTKD